MNIYVSYELRQKWPGYEFLGKPFQLSDGKTYMRALSKFHERTHFYCFQDDWFWHDSPIDYINKQFSSSESHSKI